MATKTAQRLKEKFNEMSAEMYEFLTFGELARGDKFIIFPVPGDNHGHGGLRPTHWLFVKTYKGNAISIKHGTSSDFPYEMPVIKVE